MTKSIEHLMNTKDEQIRDLQSDLKLSRKSNHDISKIAEEQITEKVRLTLKKVFTDNQIDMILGLKKKLVWTTKEKELTFLLRYHSQPAYQIVRTDMKIPFPCLRSLREWASCIEMRKGVLTNVSTMLEVAGKQMSSRDRVVLL